MELQERQRAIANDLSLHFVLPRTSLTPLLRNSSLTAQQVVYAYAAWKFAFHFIKRGSDEYNQIASILRRSHPDALPLLSRLRVTLKMHAFTERYLLDAILVNVPGVRWLYSDFTARHSPLEHDRGVEITQSQFMQRLPVEFKTEIESATFTAFYVFNKCIMKTNFYKSGKTALSFRLDPTFLPQSEYGDAPHSVDFIIGSEFRGFHVRCSEISRGPVKIIQSTDNQEFAQNLVSCFDECYYHASAQHKKNKDIPEGGSYGVILVHVAHADKAKMAFRKYVDSLLDLLLEDPRIKCRNGFKQECVFIGADPSGNGNDASMDWATLHAKKRGYAYWRTFATGRSPVNGGISPHEHGLSSHVVRAYINRLREKDNINPSECSMTVLGSPNQQWKDELISGRCVERISTMMDGTALAFDPSGLDKDELRRLASQDLPLAYFNPSVLSNGGFFIDCTNNSPEGVTLPSGQHVHNRAHYCYDFVFQSHPGDDFFIVFEGARATVTTQNVAQFAQPSTRSGMKRKQSAYDKKCKFSYILECCNLFFTQDARIALEKNYGALVFRDSSTAKGAVTASSLEVLAGFAMSEQQYADLMFVQNDQPSAFYNHFVMDVQNTITKKANQEFDFLYKIRNTLLMSLGSERLGAKISELAVCVAQSSVWQDANLKRMVLTETIPPSLINNIGFEEILKNVPEDYLLALFAKHLATSFVYKYGLNPSEIMFYEFINTTYVLKN